MTQWARRGKLVMRDDDRADLGKGVERSLSLQTTIQAIIMAELSRRGVGLDTASNAAMKFAHTGDADRNPGGLFHGGSTILAANDFGPVRHRLFVMREDESMADFEAKLHPLTESNFGCTYVNVSEVLIRAYAALHLDYGSLLDRMHADPEKKDESAERPRSTTSKPRNRGGE